MELGIDAVIKKHPIPDIDAEDFLSSVMGIAEFNENGDWLQFSCNLPFGLHSNGDSNPSAGFNRETMVYHCLAGCGSGDMFWWVQQVFDCSLRDALRIVSSKARTEIPQEDFLNKLRKALASADGKRPLPEFSTNIIEQWARPVKYLHDRGISLDTQRKFRTGFDLINKDQVQDEWLTQSRIVIPIFFQEKLRGWQKRKHNDSQLGPKYKTSHGTSKSEMLFGLDCAKHADSVVVVESPMSVLRLDSAGVPAVATMGAWPSDSQMRMMRRFDEVVIWPDNDKAGWNGTHHIIKNLQSHTDIKVIDCSKDTGDAATFSDESIHTKIEQAKPLVLLNLLGV